MDEANVLSSSTEQTIIRAEQPAGRPTATGATIGVLTVDYTGSCTTEEYALQAANAWGIGSSTGNNGVLILLVMETQQYADGDYYIDLQVTVSATPRWKVRPVPLPRPWRTTSSGRTMTTP